MARPDGTTGTGKQAKPGYQYGDLQFVREHPHDGRLRLTMTGLRV
jgi:hypothetical protein